MKRHRIGAAFTLPVLCLSSVVGLAVFRHAGDWIDTVPTAAFGLVQLSLLLFRELVVRNVLFHNSSPFVFYIQNVYNLGRDIIHNLDRIVNDFYSNILFKILII